jgi:hypothetical protein
MLGLLLFIFFLFGCMVLYHVSAMIVDISGLKEFLACLSELRVFAFFFLSVKLFLSSLF